MSLLTGLVAGRHTRSAVLGFATEQTQNDLPNLGYANAFALAGIVKIILAQLLMAFLT
jgi:putative transport protein